jgi:thiamine biosynthesis lipoprotein
MTHALTLLLLLLDARSAGSCPLRRFEYAQAHMGTRFQIILYAPYEAKARLAAEAAFKRVAALDAIMSDYNPASELMTLCKKAGGGPVRVSPELFDVLSQAQQVSQLSDGAFDVTIGPVSRLWRRARKIHELPDAEELARARTLVGYRSIVLDSQSHTATLSRAGMMLDLGGVGKGYAADAALVTLRDQGISSALVAAGGDIVVGAAPPGAEGWSVRFATHDPDEKSSPVLLLKDSAVSTSGDAEQYLEAGGKRYSHLVDPRTGMALTERISATVVAPRGALADPLTKAVAILGPERGLRLIDEIQGAAALIVRKTDCGNQTIVSKEFARLPRKTPVEGE